MPSEWWKDNGINFPNVQGLPKHSVMHEGHLPAEVLLMEAIAIEASELGVSPEQLAQHYADDIRKVRALDQESKPHRDQKNAELQRHLVRSGK